MPPKNPRKKKEEVEPVSSDEESSQSIAPKRKRAKVEIKKGETVSSESESESAPVGKKQQPKKGKGKGKGKGAVTSIDSGSDSENPLVADEQEKAKSNKAASVTEVKTKGPPRTRAEQVFNKNMTILKNALNNQSYKIRMRENFVPLAELSLKKVVEERSKERNAICELIRRELAYAHKEAIKDRDAKEWKVEHPGEIKQSNEDALKKITEESMKITAKRVAEEGELDKITARTDLATLAKAGEVDKFNASGEKRAILAQKLSDVTATTEGFNGMLENYDKKKEAKLVKSIKEHVDKIEPQDLAMLQKAWGKSSRSRFEEMIITQAAELFAEALKELQEQITELENDMSLRRKEIDRTDAEHKALLEEQQNYEKVVDEIQELEDRLTAEMKALTKEVQNHEKNIVQWKKDHAKAVQLEQNFATSVTDAFNFLANRTEKKVDASSVVTSVMAAKTDGADTKEDTSNQNPGSPNNENEMGSHSTHMDPPHMSSDSKRSDIIDLSDDDPLVVTSTTQSKDARKESPKVDAPVSSKDDGVGAKEGKQAEEQGLGGEEKTTKSSAEKKDDVPPVSELGEEMRSSIDEAKLVRSIDGQERSARTSDRSASRVGEAECITAPAVVQSSSTTVLGTDGSRVNENSSVDAMGNIVRNKQELRHEKPRVPEEHKPSKVDKDVSDMGPPTTITKTSSVATAAVTSEDSLLKRLDFNPNQAECVRRHREQFFYSRGS